MEETGCSRRGFLVSSTVCSTTLLAGCERQLLGSSESERSDGATPSEPKPEVHDATLENWAVRVGNSATATIEFSPGAATSFTRPLTIGDRQEDVTISRKGAVEVSAGEPPRLATEIEVPTAEPGRYEVLVGETRVGTLSVCRPGYRRFRQDDRNSGIVAEPGPGSGASVTWEHVGGYGHASGVGDSVFVGKQSDDGETRWVVSYDRRSGTERWRTEITPYTTAGRPQVSHDGETLYVSAATHDWGRLIALDPDSGESMWSVDTPRMSGNPVERGDHLYFIAHYGGVFAVDVTERDGAWATPIEGFPNEEWLTSNARPSVYGDVLVGCARTKGTIAGGTGNTVFGFSLEDRSVVWDDSDDGLFLLAGVVDHVRGNAYVKRRYSLHGYDATTGEKLFYLPHPEGFGRESMTTGAPALGPDHLYVCVGSNLYAVDPERGEYAWNVDVGESCSQATPILSDRSVYFLTDQVRLVEVDLMERTVTKGPAVAENVKRYSLSIVEDTALIQAYRDNERVLVAVE